MNKINILENREKNPKVQKMSKLFDLELNHVDNSFDK